MTRRTVARGSLEMRQDITKGAWNDTVSFEDYTLDELILADGDTDNFAVWWTYVGYNEMFCREYDGIKVASYESSDTWEVGFWYSAPQALLTHSPPVTFSLRCYVDRSRVMFNLPVGASRGYLWSGVDHRVAEGVRHACLVSSASSDEVFRNPSYEYEDTEESSPGWYHLTYQILDGLRLITTTRYGDEAGPILFTTEIDLGVDQSGILGLNQIPCSVAMWRNADFNGSCYLEYFKIEVG